jgi:hypothetical protein
MERLRQVEEIFQETLQSRTTIDFSDTTRMAKRKNPAAVALGRLGGKKKVPMGMAMLTPEERKKRAREGAAARWGRRGNECRR